MIYIRAGGKEEEKKEGGDNISKVIRIEFYLNSRSLVFKPDFREIQLPKAFIFFLLD